MTTEMEVWDRVQNMIGAAPIEKLSVSGWVSHDSVRRGYAKGWDDACRLIGCLLEVVSELNDRERTVYEFAGSR